MLEGLAFVLLLVGACLGDVATTQGALNTYVLYTREYDNARTSVAMPTAAELAANANLTFTELNATLDTIVVVHGHGGDQYTTLNPLIKNMFFDETTRADIDVNVIVVDWSSYTKQSYSLASSAVASVGSALGKYLKLLADQARINIDQLHLIGFNLGAHVCGFAGRELDGVAARITGLDPSGSGWGSRSPRLSSADARYVEVIHTDGNGLKSNGIGTAIGHVDFFVNGGGNQPGCITHGCSHNRAYEVFAATLVRSTPLFGYECNSSLQLSLNACRGSPAIPVGGDALFKRHGSNNVYRVNTGRTFPY